MTPGWTFLLAAGVMEIAWAQSIPPTDGFTRLWPSLVCLVLCVGSRATLMAILPALADPSAEAGPLVEHSARFIRAGIKAIAQHHKATNGPASRKGHNRE